MDTPEPATPQPAGWSPDATDLVILRHLADGRTLESIAHLLEVSERTVRRRIRTMSEELGVDSTIASVVVAVRRGLI